MPLQSGKATQPERTSQNRRKQEMERKYAHQFEPSICSVTCSKLYDWVASAGHFPNFLQVSYSSNVQCVPWKPHGLSSVIIFEFVLAIAFFHFTIVFKPLGLVWIHTRRSCTIYFYQTVLGT